MNPQPALDVLFFRIWWTYRRRDRVAWVETPYHAFNLVEGVLWLVLAGLVLRRTLRHRRTAAEFAYSLAFATFGLTDFVEAYALTSWLLWIKGINLLILLRLRRFVIDRNYPESKLY